MGEVDIIIVHGDVEAESLVGVHQCLAKCQALLYHTAFHLQRLG